MVSKLVNITVGNYRVRVRVRTRTPVRSSKRFSASLTRLPNHSQKILNSSSDLFLQYRTSIVDYSYSFELLGGNCTVFSTLGSSLLLRYQTTTLGISYCTYGAIYHTQTSLLSHNQSINQSIVSVMFHVTMNQARSTTSTSTAAFRTHPLCYAFVLLAFAAMQSRSFSFREQGLLRSNTKTNTNAKTKTNAHLLSPDSSNSNDTIDRRQLLHQIVLFTSTPLVVATTTTTAAVGAIVSLPKPAAAASWIPETTKATETFAKDKFGSVLIAAQYLASKPASDRSLVLGLKDEPTYLIVNDDKTALESFALNAECSHLGCIVPWNDFEKKFECPCHGSKYDAMGNVLRGPAPYALALAHVNTDEDSGKIVVSPWTETDFRTNGPPWWK